MNASLRLTVATLLAATALTACNKKTETPVAETPAAEAPATGGAAADGTAHVINTGDPVDGDATLTAPASVPAGSVFQADWTGPGNAADYIDLVPRGYTQTSGEITFIYIRNAEITAQLTAPTTPGEYDLRYLVDLKGERIVKTVVPLTVAPVAASFEAPPSTATGGEPLSITWSGPNNSGDYIDIVPRGYAQTSGEITYAYTANGNPAAVKAPGAPGEYEIRYVMEGRPGRVAAITSPLTVAAAEATLDAPATAAKGASINVAWTGPDRQGDYVDLVPKGYTHTSGELSYFYTRNGATGSLKAPDKAGDYEIRYVLEAPGGRRVLATSPLKVG